jgi:PAS domain S-box-containing protein
MAKATVMVERERWLHSILDNIGVGVLTLDPGGRVTFMNGVAETITGWDAPAALGLPAAQVLRVWDANAEKEIEDLREWHSPPFMECGRGEVAISRAGGRIAVEGTCAPVKDEAGSLVSYACAFRDISSCIEAHERLKTTIASLNFANTRLNQQKELFESLFRSMPCGVVAVDKYGVVHAMNPYLERLLGTSAEEAMNLPMGAVFGCINSGTEKCGCGHGKCPHDCSFWTSVQEAFLGSKTDRLQMEHDFMIRGIKKTLRISLSTATGRPEGEALCFLLVEDRTELHTLRKVLRQDASFGNMVGRDQSMQELFETIREVADSDVSVLIQGESGTGKELVAMALHENGPRKGGRFIAVNCGALPDGLLESELFGYAKGAFTGAYKDKKGRFELADGGTIFLDEVGELSQAMQVKLLRVLQSGTFERVGGEETIKVDVRVLSATNRDLPREVAEGRFRRDLFYRLCVVPILVPPLRGRRGDIPLIAEHILGRIALTHKRDVQRIAPETLACLMDHPWPGNVRELENVLQYASIKSHGNVIEPAHLPSALACISPGLAQGIRRPPRLSANAVASALKDTKGNRLRAARTLGVSRATFYRFLSTINEPRATQDS